MTTNGASPKIVLYTNHGCPWAHRAHIALAALELPFEEHIIDLNVPRTPEYLAVNPRGLVPTIVYDGETIPESAIVSQFLADAHPGKLLKSSSEPGGALQRARVNFFVDTWLSKVHPSLFGAFRASSEAERTKLSTQLVDAVAKEIEPLLDNAGPFFGGSKTITLAEVQTGSFVLRLLDFSKYGLLSTDTAQQLEAKAPNTYKWAQAVAANSSVNHIWKAQDSAEGMKAKLAKIAAESK
ncbi:MAG: hypothetical protein M1818_007099 [Claussenomyces sp. TS43310]|nr:MAG: hypothetical protein M1818_007099 [Claussenomyces sp. TS43310]